MNFKEKMAGRKFWLALLLILSSTMVMIVPAIVNAALGTAIMLLTGAEYVSMCTVVYGIYAGSNVFQKNIESKLSGSESKE